MRYLLLVLPLLLATACSGQKAPAKTKSSKAVNNANSLLWKVSKTGVKDSYVFGTIHLICEKDYFWTNAMEQALKASEKVCFELDLDDPGMMMEAAMGMMGGMGADSKSDKETKGIKELLTPAEYARYQTFLKDTLKLEGMMLAASEMIGPSMVQMLAMTKAVDCDEPVSYEQNIMAKAQADDKEILGLERVKDQMALLTGMDADTTSATILKMVDSFEVMRQGFRDMVKVYRNQDLAGLSKLMDNQTDLGDLKPFLDDRNKKWINTMSSMMTKDKMFFAVGAGHLNGPNGVLQLLRDAGYTVSPII